MKFRNGGNGVRQLRQDFSIKTSIMDTPLEVNISSRSQGLVKSRLLPIYRLAKLIMSIVLNQCLQLGSSVRELIDKYPGS